MAHLFNEVVYADATICMSSDTKAMSMCSQSTEHEGFRDGFKLNQGKLELLTTCLNAHIEFVDAIIVKRNQEVTDLRCQMKQ